MLSKVNVFVSTSRFDESNLRAANELADGRLNPTFNPHGRKMSEDEILQKLAEGYVGLIAGLEPLTDRVMSTAKSLQVIARVGTGLDSVDLNAAKRLGISVLNTPDATTDAVAELTMAHMLAVLRGLGAADRSIRHGQWSPVMGRLLRGRTVGIIGYGRIGRRVDRLVTAFGARVIFCDPQAEGGDVLQRRTLEELCKEADIVTLHVPLVAETRLILDAQLIRSLKPRAVVLNVARGGLVDEAELAVAVAEGRVLAGLDCFEEEPYIGPLSTLDEVTMTSHMGSYAEETRQLMEREAALALVRELQRRRVL